MFAKRISDEFELEILTHANKEETTILINEKNKTAPYIVTCLGCGQKIAYYRKTKLINEIINHSSSFIYCHRCSTHGSFILEKYKGKDIDVNEKLLTLANVSSIC